LQTLRREEIVAGVTPSHHRSASSAARRTREARRKRYLRRRITLFTLLLAVIAGTYFGVNWLLSRWFGQDSGAVTQPAPVTKELAFTPDKLLLAGDLDGDKSEEQVAIGPNESGQRQIALVKGTKAPFKQVGNIFRPSALQFDLKDLPQAKGVLVASGSLPVVGQPKQVTIPGGVATESNGGEPYFYAYRLDPAKGLVPDDFYALSAPAKPPADTAIVVDKWINALWFYKDGKLTATYRVATGIHVDGPKPAATNQDKNKVTPLGRFAITNLQENPRYNKLNIPGGDPKNPLGTRFLGFSVYDGDGAGVWAIHGTDERDTIGRWVSDGCIRLKNEDVEKLYDQVKPGTLLEIISSKPKQ
jgi:lipoprotein-anchoring transpeptidase ErfK/SrfK